jgi:formate dehydrogenase major subunit
LGIVAMDNQARICHSPSPAGLGPTWGRGAATGVLADIAHADAVLIMGSNMAETHVVGFQWVMEAKERGATVIHVDPRFTRTSAVADVYGQIRPGSDAAFLGGLINHVLTTRSYFHEYLLAYTNAATLVSEDYVDSEDLEGLFSGWDPVRGEYDPSSWQYDHGPDGPPDSAAGSTGVWTGLQQEGTSTRRHDGALTDPTLEHPRCVLQVLCRHFARYTPELVEEVCGIPREVFLRIAQTMVDASGPDRTAYICYAVGWTMHVHGPQIIRAAAILQTLLGNVGRPGGGIMALRGHNNVQGTTDVSTLYETLPGYLAMPSVEDVDLRTYLGARTARVGVYGGYPAYLVSALRAWYGPAATPQNDFGFGWLPRLTGDCSYETTVAAAADGDLDGMLVVGMNPVVAAMNGALQRKGFRRLKWMVVRDLDLIDTAEFWRHSPEVDRGEVRPEDVATEVFVFPAAAHTEKSGSFTNTERRLQWHDKAVEPVGDVTSDLWWVHEVGRRIKDRVSRRDDPKDAPLHALVWDYDIPGRDESPDPEAVLREMNGCDHHGRLITSPTELRADGSTACGVWVYAGCMTEAGNRTRSRVPASAADPYGHDWGWSWPGNRRILYNRASARPDGRPWSDRKALVWWDAEAGRWTGRDVPDFPLTTPPSYVPGDDAQDAMARIGGCDPFIAKSDGKAWLFAPSGMRDGPLPIHVEPVEGTLRNRVYRQQTNPARTEYDRPDNPYHWAFDDPRFPVILSTNRMAEMYGAGAMSRWLPWLAELQPAPVVEMSPELAKEVGVRNGGWVTLVTARGRASARALVTGRIRPLVLGGRTHHHAAASYHYGRKGLVTGDPLNELFALSGEPNTTIQGSKVTSVAILAGKDAPVEAVLARDGGHQPPDDVRRDLPSVGPRVRGAHGYVGPVSRAHGLEAL